MKMRFLIGTASLLLSATAFAQSPSATTSSPGTQQMQSPSSSSPATQKSPDTPHNNQATSPGSSSASPQTPTTAPATSAGSSTSQPSQAQTNTSSPQTTGSQAQTSGGGTANSAAQPSNNASQSPSVNSSAQTPSTNNAAQTPSTGNNAQSPSTNLNASVNISDQQRTRVSQSISRAEVQAINNVNFSLTVGTSVPRDIRLQTLPSEVVEVVPQYRGYSFFVVRDEIVIVEPSSLKIVTVLPRSGGSTAAASAPARSKVSFTDKDRDAVRKHVKTRTVERQTTGSSAKTVIRRGERLPETVEVEEFPDVVYREAPSLRDYRYIHRENRTYLVDPRERMVIEEID